MIRIEYVVGFVEPYNVWVWLGTRTDAEREALGTDNPLIGPVRQVLLESGLPLGRVGVIGTSAQSQETVDRDYEGSWFYALR